MFAIDITKNTIRLLKLKKENNTFKIDGAIDMEFDEKKAEKEPEIISATIKSGMKKAKPNKIEDDEVGFAVPEEHCFTKILTIDNSVSEKDIPNIIEHEIPYSMEEIYWDYQRLNNKEIIFSAAPRNIIDYYINIANLANLKTIIVETEANALVWGSLTPSKSNEYKNILIIYLDKNKINVVIWSNNAIQFTTNDKFEYKSITTKSPNKKEIEYLTQKVKKYIDFYNEHNKEQSDKKINKIILTGIWENFVSLKKELNISTNIPVFGPSRLLSINSTYTVVLGIALRGIKSN